LLSPLAPPKVSTAVGAGYRRNRFAQAYAASPRTAGHQQFSRSDYVDLYQIHRWDHETSIEETLQALHDVVKAGKVRYIGASSIYAWQFGKALAVAERNGWTRFVSMQNLVNLLYERRNARCCRSARRRNRRDPVEPTGTR
jgi:aryl-alcohol dehydrogenase-like predicted oxidoreductase